MSRRIGETPREWVTKEVTTKFLVLTYLRVLETVTLPSSIASISCWFPLSKISSGARYAALAHAQLLTSLGLGYWETGPWAAL